MKSIYPHKAVLTCPYCGSSLVVEDDNVVCWTCEVWWNEEGMPA